MAKAFNATGHSCLQKHLWCSNQGFRAFFLHLFSNSKQWPLTDTQTVYIGSCLLTTYCDILRCAFPVTVLRLAYQGDLQMLQNIVDKSALGLSISGRIVLRSRNKNLLDFHIICNDCMPLATWITKGFHDS